jgi:hypothetical protein
MDDPVGWKSAAHTQVRDGESACPDLDMPAQT